MFSFQKGVEASPQRWLEYSERLPFLFEIKVKVSSSVKPGEWLPITIVFKALRSMRFYVDISVEYGYARWTNWSRLLDRELSFMESVTLLHSVYIPMDVETGPVLIWLTVGYTDDSYYCREGPSYYYVEWNWIVAGPYVEGITPKIVPQTEERICHPSYPDLCIPPSPSDLDCEDIPYRNFRVLWDVPNPDPHHFDMDKDGIGCETG